MFKSMLTAAIATLVAVPALAAPPPATTRIEFRFDGTYSGAVDSALIGTGVFTTPDALTVGRFSMASLSSFTLELTFGTTVFTFADFSNPLANAYYQYSLTPGRALLFSSSNNGGVSFGGFGFSKTVANPINGFPDFISFAPNFLEPSFFAGTSAGQSIGDFDSNVATAAVPEPSSWLMLIAGFGLVGAMARRRKAALAA